MIKLQDNYGRDPAEAARILDALGGNSEAARMVGVTPQALSYWRRKGIPALWLKVLRSSHKHLFPAQQPIKKPKALEDRRCPQCGHVGPMYLINQKEAKA